ncbi:MAG TPA: hypothetical protein VF517_06520 [Thermoleophilaceae bacterium]|jgi:hypothetical protein
MAEGQGSLRLTFSYEGRRVELQSVEPVDAVAPAPPVSPRGTAGFALEVHGRGGTVLFKRMLDEPFGESVEVPAGDRDPERPFERAAVENPSGTFIVMVPALAAGAEVALFDRRGDKRRGAAHDEPVARFELPARGRPGGPGKQGRGRHGPEGEKGRA